MRIPSSLFLLSFAVFAGSAQASLAVNGSMNVAVPPDVNSYNGVQPDSWNDIAISSSTDIFDSTTTFNGFNWDSSADGGTFVHGLGPISTIPGEGILQEISGLTIGAVYEVKFEQSISWSTNQSAGELGGNWEVVFGNETQQSAFMSNPGQGNAFGWQNQSMLFEAMAETQILSFQVVPSVFGDRVDLGLDGVSVTSSVIPIPAAAWLFGSALIGLAGVARRKRATYSNLSYGDYSSFESCFYSSQRKPHTRWGKA